MARAKLAIGGVALIGAGVAIASGWWWPSTAEATAQVTEPVRTVEVGNDSGNVTIRAADVGRTTVRQTFEYRWGEPEGAYTVTGGELVLGGCGSWCSVDYEVTVPRGTTVTGGIDSGDLRLAGVASAEVDADSGNVRVADVAGPVRVQADSGDVELDRVGDAVTVQVSSGNVTGHGLAGPVQVDASSGNARLELVRPQDVRASVDSGNVAVTVPAGAYRVSGSTDSGNRRVEVQRSASAPHELQLDTDSGNVTVLAGQARG